MWKTISTDLDERDAVNSLQQFAVDEVDADCSAGPCDLPGLNATRVLVVPR